MIQNEKIKCRKGCGACCIAISISSPIPGMPTGKASGTPCIHLENGLCKLFGRPQRPSVCLSFPAMKDICGNSREEALQLIFKMEELTK